MAEHHEGTSDGHEHREAPGLGDAAGSPSARTPAPARDAGPRPGGPRRWVPWAIGAAVVVLALVVAFGPGLLATRVVAPRLARTLGVPVAIGWLWWNPFTGWWTVTALQVGATAGEPALAARPLAARVYLWDVLRGRRRVRGLQVGRAAVRATPTATGWSLPLPPAEAGGGRFFFTVEHADVRQTTIRLEPAGAAPVRVRVRRLDVSTLGVEPPATWASGWLHASVAGRALRAAVSYRATDARARARARLLTHRLDLAHLAALVPSPDRRVAGHLTLEGTYAGATREGRVRRLVAGRLALRDAAVGAAGAQGLTARAVTLSRSRVGLVRRKAALGRLRVREAEAWLEGAAGALRIPGVWEPGGGAGPAWHLTARGASLDGGRLHYEAAGRPPLVVRVPRATVGRAPAGAAPVPVSLVLEPESGGRVSVNGRVVREPLAVDADVAADGLELAPLAAWAGTRLELASGRADAALHVASEGGGLAASGDVTVDDLKSVAPADAPEEV
ncbi:MAG TPA: DUF748 domain-containing protein, partial [Candidatus Binatia bacterium]|nr:DUF748 domain-containing protein [Candidatus Binatia bacterium]